MWVERNGVRLSADVRGEGESVVFVCGTAMRSPQWELLGRPDLEAAGLRTVVYDQRGIAPSDCPPPPYSMQDLADDAVAVIEQTGSAPCHLVGISLGANTASMVARQRPDLVRSLVLLAGGANIRAGAPDNLRASIAAYQAGGEQAATVRKLGLLLAFVPYGEPLDGPAVTETVLLSLEGFAPASDDWTGSIGQATANLDWAESDHLAEAAQISVPTLMLASERDFAFDPADARAAASAIPDCEFVLYDGQPHVATDPDVNADLRARLVAFATSHGSGTGGR